MEVFDMTPLSAEEAIKAQSEFQSIDADGNGRLDSEELFNYIKKFKPELLTFTNLILHVFGNGSTIDWSQFYYSYKSFSAPKDADNYLLRVIFKFIDTDGNGTISAKEYQKIVSYLNAPGNNQMRLAGIVDPDNELDYDAFVKTFIHDLEFYWKICLPKD